MILDLALVALFVALWLLAAPPPRFRADWPFGLRVRHRTPNRRQPRLLGARSLRTPNSRRSFQ